MYKLEEHAYVAYVGLPWGLHMSKPALLAQ